MNKKILWVVYFVVATIVLLSIIPLPNCVMTGKVGMNVDSGISLFLGRGASENEPVYCPSFIPRFEEGTVEYYNANKLITAIHLILIPPMFCIVFGVVLFTEIKDIIKKHKKKEECKDG